MSKSHRDFLIKLGVKVVPPLQSVMKFMENQCTDKGRVRDENVYEAALTFLTQRLGPNGIFDKEYTQRYKHVKFLPCIKQNLETGEVIREIQSPLGELDILVPFHHLNSIVLILQHFALISLLSLLL
jgi:hypothetical protein